MSLQVLTENMIFCHVFNQPPYCPQWKARSFVCFLWLLKVISGFYNILKGLPEQWPHWKII